MRSKVRQSSVLAVPLRGQPQIRVATRAPLDDRSFAVKYQADHHALHLHDYAGTIRIGGKTYDLQPGDVTISPAGVPSWYDLPRAGTHLVIHFQWADESSDPQTADVPLHQSLGDQHIEADVRMRRIIQLRATAGEGPLARVAASTALQSLLLWLALRAEREPAPGGSTVMRAVTAVADLIERNLSRNLTVKELAAHSGLSQNYLARHFREYFGMTMQQFATARRIELARELLLSTDLPIKTIGRRVGVPDPQYFNKLFRNNTGVSPSAMRSG